MATVRTLIMGIVILGVVVGSRIALAGDTRQAGKAGSAPGPISICLGGTPGLFPLLALKQGFFAAEGLAVEAKEFPTTTEGLTHFFQDECQLASISETAIVIESLAHREFAVLATVGTSDDSAHILASKGRGIATPEDLRGKRILVPQWSSNHFFLDMFLAKHGLSEQDVVLFARKKFQDPIAAFARGEIDAFCATRVVIDKPRRALADDAVVFSDPGLCLASYHVVARKEFVREHPEAIRQVLAALLKNEAWVRDNRDAAIRAAAASQNIDLPTMAAAWNEHRWKVELSQTLLLSLEQEARWAIDAGFAPAEKIPDYLDFFYRDGLLSLRPESVTLLP